MKLGQKIFYISTTILEVVLMIAAYIVNYFTKTRMGMGRHVIHKNYILENTYPMGFLKYSIILLFLVMMVIVVFMYSKRKDNLLEIAKKMNIAMIISTILFAVFIIIGSIESMRAFYYVSAILSIVVLIQIIKTFIGIMWYRK